VSKSSGYEASALTVTFVAFPMVPFGKRIVPLGKVIGPPAALANDEKSKAEPKSRGFNSC
jgi:hypothetical protein